MYYEEKIVNGVLCSRTSPHGNFVPLSAEKLTKKVLDMQQRLNDLGY